MNKLLTTSLGIAFSCTAFFATSPALACHKHLSNHKIQRRIQGNWHLAQPFEKNDMHYDVHVSFTRTGEHNGTFESYANETTNQNPTVTINGNYEIAECSINATITKSSLPIEGQTKSYKVVSLSHHTMTISDGANEITLDRE